MTETKTDSLIYFKKIRKVLLFELIILACILIISYIYFATIKESCIGLSLLGIGLISGTLLIFISSCTPFMWKDVGFFYKRLINVLILFLVSVPLCIFFIFLFISILKFLSIDTVAGCTM
jgi:hypothetical protein